LVRLLARRLASISAGESRVCFAVLRSFELASRALLVVAVIAAATTIVTSGCSPRRRGRALIGDLRRVLPSEVARRGGRRRCELRCRELLHE
jgi:hypothetical protein